MTPKTQLMKKRHKQTNLRRRENLGFQLNQPSKLARNGYRDTAPNRGNPWVPKTATGQIQETSKDVNTATQDVKLQDNPIRAWGTGYGSKTWKGNEWDSNVVWKTGFGGALPWTTENSTWKFPDQTNEDSQDKDKKSIVWSQPIPSEDDEPVSNSKSVNQPGKSLNNIRIKWPTKPTNVKWKTPPSRRTEDESWGDDSSEGGVIWKDQSTEPTPTDAPIGESPVKPNLNINFNKGWQSSGWLNNQDVDAKPITFTWKNKPPQKTSNLISVNWKSDESVTNPPPTPAPAPVAWNQGQWPAVNQGSFPNWIFGGCKLTIKCGSSESDTNEDDSIQTTPQDTSDDTSAISTDAPTTTAIIKGWPVHQFKGKSWRPPPTKSWRPPPSKSWKPPKKSSRPPTPPSTMPDTPPPTAPPNMGWKNPGPPPNVMWKKPQPPPGWKQPPSGWKQPPTPPPTTPWIESTTMPPPSMSWKPPPSPPPSSMKWKKPGPRPPKSWRPPPNKSWKPPPTKSWKPPTGPGKSWQPPTGPGKSWQPPTGPGKSWQPPTGPGKSWQPSIATPAPDSWSTPTKPDCKDSSEPAQPSPEPNPEDEEQEINPPQIIIITKLPNNQKSPMPSTDKWDTRNDRKSKKPPSKSKIPNKSWIFPSRKVSQKSNKNQKDMTGRMVGKWPIRPRKVSKPGNKIRGWPKGMPLPNFTWPANNMRRLTTKRPTSMNTWKPQKYMKSKAWRQILKKWMKARM
ncbi:uncharacterized protein CDAR_250411 [Caerostris darwini]|uniref:Uncharacterized protein n=1 Tax=Caerostris darwini TaxID=1538125 RepID=A0AAV4UEF2_9ARAC|nr:uncharacterized protein CDAR_250411 [Caerostris darwini]